MEDTRVIVIGASAGGIEALPQITAALTPTWDLARSAGQRSLNSALQFISQSIPVGDVGRLGLLESAQKIECHTGVVAAQFELCDQFSLASDMPLAQRNVTFRYAESFAGACSIHTAGLRRSRPYERHLIAV